MNSLKWERSHKAVSQSSKTDFGIFEIIEQRPKGECCLLRFYFIGIAKYVMFCGDFASPDEAKKFVEEYVISRERTNEYACPAST
jgi:hypothetical protein